MTPAAGEGAATRADKDYVPALRFAWLTGAYDLVVRMTTRESTFKRALMAQAAIVPGDRVLDVGCGTGTLAVWIKLEEPRAEVTGLDGDPAILARAARKAHSNGADIRFDCAMSHALPYADEQFHRVVSSLFFHHLSPEDKRATAREMLRVLRPGGELHVADWGLPGNTLMRVLFVFVRLLDGFRNTADNVSGRLPAILREAGFADVGTPRRFSTVFGTLALHAARKPERPGADEPALASPVPPGTHAAP